MGVAGEVVPESDNLPSRVIEPELLSETPSTGSKASDPFSFAVGAGLSHKQVQAAVALAFGSSRAEVAAQAGVTIQTLDKWKRDNFVFRAFLAKLNADAMESARTEAVGILNRQLLGKKPGGIHEQSTKDIFDWVKLALSTDGGHGGRVPAPSVPSVLHQHVHFESAAQGAGNPAADDSVLLNLHTASKTLSGDKRRRLAELLRGQ